MRRVKLTKQEQEIEHALIEGVYISSGEKHLKTIAEAIVNRRKDAVLNIRLNSQDLKQLKQKANRLGIKYQTFISEILHRIAQN